ncbi:c-type cytochrome [Rubritalea tangerina]|uniref:C-type cytochrome n=1 Tax=Rubritalea tangerina TaxID=430798 RepID=A0ABW4ZBX4_9BACT
MSPKANDAQRIVALWSLESLGVFDEAVWKYALRSENENVRFEAVRALSSLSVESALVDDLLRPLEKDRSFYVRNEVVRYYRDSPSALSAGQRAMLEKMKISSPPTEKVKGWKGQYLAMGGSYESAFLNLLISKALNKEAAEVAVVDEAAWNIFIAEEPAKSPADRKALDANIHRLVKLAEAGGGSLDKGKAHYEARCAACHSQEKNGFAPALNGGKARSHEALLTAILDPNAAAEEVFYVYRIEKKDGSVLEGFRSDINTKGVELTYMGGSKVFTPLKDIKKAGYVKGKSVMLENMAAGLSDTDMVDLLSYLRSID